MRKLKRSFFDNDLLSYRPSASATSHWRRQHHKHPLDSTPIASDPDALLRADPGFDQPLSTDEGPVHTCLKPEGWVKLHKLHCDTCRTHSPSSTTNDFTDLHPRCYGRVLCHRIRYGYLPSLQMDIPTFNVPNYSSVSPDDPECRKAWAKQTKNSWVFSAPFPEPPPYVNALTASTKDIDAWKAKKTGKPPKRRICVDLSTHLNDCLRPWPMRYSGFSNVMRNLRRYDWAVIVDFSSFFNCVPVRPSFSKFLGLRDPVTGLYLRYKVLPFGLTTAAQMASVVSAEAARIIRHRLKRYTNAYIDDVIVLFPSKAEALAGLDIILTTCRELGLPLNPDKIQPPSQSFKYLGWYVCTRSMVVSVDPDKRQLVLDQLHTITARAHQRRQHPHRTRRAKASRRQLASLAGRLQWLAEAIPGARPRTHLIHALTAKLRRPWHVARLSVQVIADLTWWTDTLTAGKTNLQTPIRNWADTPCAAMASDASGTDGYGAVFGNRLYAGKWATNAPQGVPAKELWPIVRIVETFAPALAGCAFVCWTDSVTVFFAVNTGSSRSRHLDPLIRRLFDTCAKHNIEPIALWLPREHNTASDDLSKGVHPQQAQAASLSTDKSIAT